MSLQSLLNVSVTIARNAPTSDGQGGFVENLRAVTTTRARIRSLSLRELEAIAQRFPKVSTVVYLNYGTNVLEGDVIDAGTQGTLRVANVNSPSKLGHHLEVRCEKIPAVVVNAATPAVS